MSTSTTNTTAAAPSATAVSGGAAFRMPSQTTFQNAFKKAIETDRPILFDYFMGSVEKKVAIGVQQEGKVKILIRSDEEYTSPIQNIFRSENDFIILTENSIYVVDSGIPVKKIQ